MTQLAKNLAAMQETQEIQVRFQGWEEPLEEGMSTHFSILAWRIPWSRAWWAIVHRVEKSRTRLSDLAHTPQSLAFFLKNCIPPATIKARGAFDPPLFPLCWILRSSYFTPGISLNISFSQCCSSTHFPLVSAFDIVETAEKHILFFLFCFLQEILFFSFS